MSTQSAKIAADNSAGTSAIVYQFYVALQKCCELGVGESVYIERYGDVSVPGREQTEVKRYREATPLTDSCENFWNTLKNWLDDKFDDRLFKSLVLLTTQGFGARSRFVAWNEATAADRLKILQAIHADSLQRFKQSGKDPKDMPDVLVHQNDCMASEREAKLKHVIPKVYISLGTYDGKTFHDKIKAQYAKPIDPDYSDQFIHGLLGYVAGFTSDKDQFHITYDDFAAQCSDLASLYCKHTKRFPRISPPTTLSRDELEKKSKSLFVQKIKDIDYHEVIEEAIRHYITAANIVDQDFREMDGHSQDYKEFLQNVEENATTRYRQACLNRNPTENIVKSSQKHYNDSMLAPAINFPGREEPLPSFHKGVLHIISDDPSKKLKWRLE